MNIGVSHNLIEGIFNSINNIKKQISLIFNSKDMFLNDKDLIIFCYLLGYFSFIKNISDEQKILNSILVFSCRNRTDEKELSNVIINASLVLNDNFLREDLINYQSKNIFSFNKTNSKTNKNIQIEENIFNNKISKEKNNNLDISKNSIKKNEEENLLINKNKINEKEKEKQNNEDDSLILKEKNKSENNFNLLINSESNLNDKNNNNNIEKNNINLKNSIFNFNLSNKKDKLNEEEKDIKFLGKKTFLPKKMKMCDICCDEFDENDPYNYELECGCIIHYECLDEHIKTSVESNNIPILCPYCQIEIHPNMIYDSLNTNKHFDLIQKYEKFSMNNLLMNNKDSYSCCPTPGCEYMFFFEEGENRFLCPLCNKEYCLFCKNVWHKGMTCKEFQESKDEKKLDEKFLNFVKGANYKICPICKFWVEKAYGCESMKCRCGNKFCYRCGNSIPKKKHDCPCWGRGRNRSWQ